MALKKEVKIKNTVPFPGAYCRIKALRFDHPSRVWVEVGVYETKDSPTVLDTFEYTMTVEDFGTKEQINCKSAYAKLKEKEEWVDAEDV